MGSVRIPIISGGSGNDANDDGTTMPLKNIYDPNYQVRVFG